MMPFSSMNTMIILDVILYMEDLNISVNYPCTFCNLSQRLCGEMESMYFLLLAPWRVVQPVIDGFTTTPIVWNAVTVYWYTIEMCYLEQG